ncbi:MAG: 4Fe-4S dicluster domain-containing protein [Candidatus Omnitrophica bacterium]|nr:4Fe-4S dicluster domain-containing protein [Candidatus Omnitrophota bacterium]
MAKILINKDKCKGCLLCVASCPRKLIIKSSRLNKRGSNYVEFKEAQECLGCAFCAMVCPDCCIEVYK